MEKEELLYKIQQIENIKFIKSKTSLMSDIRKIKARVLDDTFRIAVVGEFSSGKSTFINGLLGRDILLHAVNETTAAITCIYNVVDKDTRMGSCEIEYNNGTKKVIKDFTSLRDYTTTQSKLDVADKIRSVSIYAHFMDSEVPLVIVDTPGLNGIADKHRDITIEEVKRAHACIYLLSLKGVTNTDKDFINVLSNYQSNFIFIQNFIDSLHLSDGETPEKKISEDKLLLGKLFSENDFTYEICGISALKSLASKDYGITRLYESDTVELTKEDRERLREESNIIQFERILKGMVTSRRYKQVVLDSAVQALESLLSQILFRLDSRQQVNDELLKQDDKSRRIERAQNVINNLRAQEGDRLHRLDNFLISKDSENQKGLKEYVESRLKKVYESVCTEIDDRIKCYDDLNRVDLRYFGSYVSNILNGDVIPDLDQRIALNLSHLYEMGTQRAAEYSVTISDERAGIVFSIDSIQEEIKAQIESEERKINNVQSKIKSDENEKEKLNDKIKEVEIKIERTADDVKKNENEHKKAEGEYRNNIESLGRKPDIHKWKEEKKVPVKRHGIIGWFKDFFSTEYRIVYEEHEDDSAQREWMRRKSQYDSKIEYKRREVNAKRNELENRQRQLQVEKSSSERQRDSIEQSIRALKQEIENRNEIIRNNQNEACQIQKKRLKERIEDELMGTSGGECNLEHLKSHIAEMSGRHMDAIKNTVHRYYLDSIKDKIKSYQNIIDNNTQRLEEQYMADKNDMIALTEILNSLK